MSYVQKILQHIVDKIVILRPLRMLSDYFDQAHITSNYFDYFYAISVHFGTLGLYRMLSATSVHFIFRTLLRTELESQSKVTKTSAKMTVAPVSKFFKNTIDYFLSICCYQILNFECYSMLNKYLPTFVSSSLFSSALGSLRSTFDALAQFRSTSGLSASLRKSIWLTPVTSATYIYFTRERL